VAHKLILNLEEQWSSPVPRSWTYSWLDQLQLGDQRDCLETGVTVKNLWKICFCSRTIK